MHMLWNRNSVPVCAIGLNAQTKKGVICALISQWEDWLTIGDLAEWRVVSPQPEQPRYVPAFTKQVLNKSDLLLYYRARFLTLTFAAFNKCAAKGKILLSRIHHIKVALCLSSSEIKRINRRFLVHRLQNETCLWHQCIYCCQGILKVFTWRLTWTNDR